MARHQVTQGHLSRSLNMSQQALSRRLSGAVDFTVGEMFAIAELLDVTIDSLLAVAAEASA